MKKVLVLSLLSIGITALAHAQATRTWVSGVGDDVNPCSRTAPCKTFAGAISKTASPGIINCLDPGGFGAVTITKSITIDCTGTLGSVLSSGVQGVIINGLTTSNIVLRNIDINGAGTTLGTNGVNLIQAGSLIVDHVTIGNYSGQGIIASNGSNTPKVDVVNCVIDNVNANGIILFNGGGGVKMMVAHTQVLNTGANGIYASGGANVVELRDVNVSKAAGVGFQIDNGSSTAYLEGVTLFANATGLNSLAGTNTRLSRSVITASTVNGITGAGTTRCFGSNVVEGNAGTQTCTNANVAQQ
jgi:hypothetical protein